MAANSSYQEYHRARLGGQLRLGSRPAVVVVDLQYGFTDPSYALGSDLTHEVGETRALLEVAREQDVPVFFTVIAFSPERNDFGLWLEKVPSLADLVEGTRATAIDERLNRQPNEVVIPKKGASGMFGTALCSLLVEQGIDTVVLCGATTSGCVRATAVDLLQYGFRTLVPRGCVGDRARAAHDASLIDLDAKYCDVVDAADVREYLRSVAPVRAASGLP